MTELPITHRFISLGAGVQSSTLHSGRIVDVRSVFTTPDIRKLQTVPTVPTVPTVATPSTTEEEWLEFAQWMHQNYPDPEDDR